MGSLQGLTLGSIGIRQLQTKQHSYTTNYWRTETYSEKVHQSLNSIDIWYNTDIDRLTDKFYQHSRNSKGKGNVDLYSLSSRTPLTRSDMDHTVLPANNTISAFIRKHSPGGVTTHIRTANAWVQLTTHLSTPRGSMAELAMLSRFTRRRSPVNCTSRRRAGKVRSS